MTPDSNKTISAKLEFIIPLVLLIFGTALFLFSDLDLTISGALYDSDNRSWYLSEHPLIHTSYIYGPYLSSLLAFAALVHLLASYMLPRYLPKRAVSAFILLSLLVGPIVLVNGVIKESWRRPRPRNITEFHGVHEFKKVLVINQTDFNGKSFPSGHASSGFILVVLYFLLKRKRPKLAMASLLFSLLLGTWLGFVRIAGGGHFASDILWALGVNWYVVMLLYYKWYIRYEEKLSIKTLFYPSIKRYLIVFVLLLMGIGVVLFRFLYSTPLDVRYDPQIVRLPSHIKQIEIKMRAEKGNLTVRKGKAGEVQFRTWLRGHALPNFDADRTLDVKKGKTVWKFEYSIKPGSFFFYEYQSHSNVYIPPDVKINFDLFTNLGTIRRKDLLNR